MKESWKWLPPWNMPRDPVQALFWFMRWLLQVLVRYFWVVILGAVSYETYLNSWVGLFGTLLVGLLVWGGLAVTLFVVNIFASISRVYSEFTRVSKDPTNLFSVTQEPVDEENVVEGTIITDLDEERRKRRHEM